MISRYSRWVLGNLELPSSSSSLKNSSLSFAECDFFISAIRLRGILRRRDGEKNEGRFFSGVGGVLKEVTYKTIQGLKHRGWKTIPSGSRFDPVNKTVRFKQILNEDNESFPFYFWGKTNQNLKPDDVTSRFFQCQLKKKKVSPISSSNKWEENLSCLMSRHNHHDILNLSSEGNEIIY